MENGWRAAFAFSTAPKAGPSDEETHYLALSAIKQENPPRAFSAWACSWVVLASDSLPAVLKKKNGKKERG